MTSLTSSRIPTTVNALYGRNLSASDLAQSILDHWSAAVADGPTLAFFSEVDLPPQLAFVEEVGLDLETVVRVAKAFAVRSGFDLPFAR